MFWPAKLRSIAAVPRRTRPPFEWLYHCEGSAILEFAVTIPLLVVFVVGIFDFSGAFNQKQKIEQAAQEGAIVAGAQPTSDIYVGSANPPSLQPVVAAVFNSLAGAGVLPLASSSGNCSLSPAPTGVETTGLLIWTYTISGCANGTSASDQLTITINRGWVVAGSNTAPSVVGTSVAVSFPYHWRFNSVIQVLIPGASYQAITNVTETAYVHNQM
ncbi:MAG: TadE/TadG family type IV pilus assembly protein [Terriglobales bacterium]